MGLRDACGSDEPTGAVVNRGACIKPGGGPDTDVEPTGALVNRGAGTGPGGGHATYDEPSGAVDNRGACTYPGGGGPDINDEPTGENS